MTGSVGTDVVVPCGAERARTRLDVVLHPPGWRDYGRTSVSDLPWTATGRRRRFLPTFDAEVAVTAIDDISCLLTIVGTYAPPLGRIGRIADRTLLHGVAASTAHDFADRLARALAHDTRLVDQRKGRP